MEIKKNDIINFTKEELDNLEKTENKRIIIEFKKDLTTEEKQTIAILETIKEPFTMLDTRDVMQDLNISESLVYKLFRREDFPSINIGKRNQIMLLPYILWKMKKRI